MRTFIATDSAQNRGQYDKIRAKRWQVLLFENRKGHVWRCIGYYSGW